MFGEAGARDKLEQLASVNCLNHYRLPQDEDTVMPEKKPWTALAAMRVDRPDEMAVIYKGGETVEWQVVEA